MPENVVQIGECGPLFKLREPITLDDVRMSPVLAELDRPWMCRRLHLHSWQEIGEPYYPTDDPVAGALAALANSDVSALIRCRRCHRLAMRGR